MKAPRETDLVRACLQLLQLHRIPAWRNNAGAATFAGGGRKRFVRFGVEGGSDVLAVLPPEGRLLAVECKRPGGRLTEAQKAFLDAVCAAGGLALVVRELRDLERALRLEGPNDGG
jgi:hypothetical protein